MSLYRTSLYDNKGLRATLMGQDRTKIEWIRRKKVKMEKKIIGQCETCGEEYVIDKDVEIVTKGYVEVTCPHCKQISYNWK